MAIALSSAAGARSLAPQGCPISHCNPPSTGVILQPLIDAATTNSSTNAPGSLHAEGCSGDGTRLMCLFATDQAAPARKGTLKALDATTLKPIWGSAASGGPDLDPNTAAYGQVPTIFDDGSVAAGDSTVENLYSSSGSLLAQLPLTGQGNNFGLVPMSPGYGIVANGNGVLTLVDLTNWQRLGSLTLIDPLTLNAVTPVAPASASAGALYVLTYDSTQDSGTLYSVVIDPNTLQLKVRSTFSFIGRSAAKPVVVTTDVSGLGADLILVHVRGLIGDATPRNRLVGIVDGGAQLSRRWSISLSAPLTVSPSVDAGSRSLFYKSASYIRQCSLSSGAPLQIYNLATIGGFPASFRINGHIGGSSGGGVFTLLLSGGVSSPASNAGEYAMAFQPMVSPTTLLWNQKISDQIAGYTGAYNFSSASQAGAVCPIMISINGLTSTLTRLCDH